MLSSLKSLLVTLPMRAQTRWAEGIDLQYAGRLCLASVIAAAYASPSFGQTAAGKDPLAMLTNVEDFILGPFGQTLAILGIIGIGVSWMFGRASLGLVASVVGGIVIMFGAAFLGTALTK